MLPILLNLGPIKIYTFGVFLVLAFFWSSFILWKLIRLTSYKEEEVFDSMFFSLFIGLITGRLFYVVFHAKDFGGDILKMILINGYPGMSVYGVLIGFIATLFIISQLKKIDFKELIDYFMMPLFIALAIGKIGAFISGVEAGTMTKFKFPLAIKILGLAGARHLTPLYESVLFFVATFICYKIIFEIRREKYSHGFLLLLGSFIYSLVYILFDSIRGVKEGFVGLNINLMLSYIILLTSGLVFIYYFRSLISARLGVVSNFLFKNGQKAIKNTIFKRPKKTGGGEKKTHNEN